MGVGASLIASRLYLDLLTELDVDCLIVHLTAHMEDFPIILPRESPDARSLPLCMLPIAPAIVTVELPRLLAQLEPLVPDKG